MGFPKLGRAGEEWGKGRKKKPAWYELTLNGNLRGPGIYNSGIEGFVI